MCSITSVITSTTTRTTCVTLMAVQRCRCSNAQQLCFGARSQRRWPKTERERNENNANNIHVTQGTPHAIPAEPGDKMNIAFWNGTRHSRCSSKKVGGSGVAVSARGQRCHGSVCHPAPDVGVASTAFDQKSPSRWETPYPYRAPAAAPTAAPTTGMGRRACPITEPTTALPAAAICGWNCHSSAVSSSACCGVIACPAIVESGAGSSTERRGGVGDGGLVWGRNVRENVFLGFDCGSRRVASRWVFAFVNHVSSVTPRRTRPAWFARQIQRTTPVLTPLRCTASPALAPA